MALTQYIKFRNLATQLSAAETTSFLNQLFASSPRFILDILFSHSLHQSQTSGNDTVRFNAMISKIIKSRDEPAEDTPAIALDTLPQRLIGVAASYLDQISYTRLSCCSRLVYLGCNSPIQSTELYLSNGQRPNDLTLYPFVEHITFFHPQQTDHDRPYGELVTLRHLRSLKIQSMEDNPEFLLNMLQHLAAHQNVADNIHSLNIAIYQELRLSTVGQLVIPHLQP